MPKFPRRIFRVVVIPPRKVLTLAAMLQMTPAYGGIGMIDALAGDVRVVAEGQELSARSGFILREGHTVTTGDQAWALFAMSDGAGVVLHPKSQLRFDIYRYSHAVDVTRTCCLLTLAQGAFRFITGLIGRNGRTSLPVSPTTVQIGIRG